MSGYTNHPAVDYWLSKFPAVPWSEEISCRREAVWGLGLIDTGYHMNSSTNSDVIRTSDETEASLQIRAHLCHAIITLPCPASTTPSLRVLPPSINLPHPSLCLSLCLQGTQAKTVLCLPYFLLCLLHISISKSHVHIHSNIFSQTFRL